MAENARLVIAPTAVADTDDPPVPIVYV